MSRNEKYLRHSFAGGELSPEMFGRLDDVKYQAGAATLQNLIVQPNGSADRRTGTRMVRRSKDPTKTSQLFGFAFNNDQSMVVEASRAPVTGREIGHFRFHTAGASLLYETPDTYIGAQRVTIYNTANGYVGIVGHSFQTGDPVALTMYPEPGVGNTAVFGAASASGTLQVTFTPSTGAMSTSGGHQVVFRKSTSGGPTLPSNIEEGRFYWTLPNNELSESRNGPPLEHVATSSGNIRFAAMPEYVEATDRAAPTVPALANHVYYAIYVDGNNIRLAWTYADAIAGNYLVDSVSEGERDTSRKAHYAYRNGDLVRHSGDDYYAFRAPWCSADVPDDHNRVDSTDHNGVPPTGTNHWMALPGINATVTVDTGADTIDWGSAHNLSSGDPFVVEDATTTAPAPLVEGTVYYVINPTANTFQASLTPMGPPVDLTTAGTSVQVLANPIYEVPHFFTEGNLPQITTAQSGDVLTLAHRDRPVAELRRVSATRWELHDVRFGAAVAAPETPFESVTNRGEGHEITAVTTASPGVFTLGGEHFFAVGDPVEVEDMSAAGVSDGYYRVGTVPAGNQVTLRHIEDNGYVNPSTTTLGSNPRMRYTEPGVERASTYAVTAVDGDGEESPASGTLEVDNNLLVVGAYNTIQWNAVGGATRYRVYKQENGLLGFIGETEQLTFKDDNIEPDLGITPPIPDTALRRTSVVTFDATGDAVAWADHGLLDGDPVVFRTNDTMPGVTHGETYLVANAAEDSFQIQDSAGAIVNITGTDTGTHRAVAGKFPASVAYAEGRRVFAGSRTLPQDVWMTASGTEADLSYSLPTVDTDRIYFRIAAREFSPVRHVVPLSQLLLLSGSTELRLTPVNDDAITPDSISVRPQSYVGCGYPQPAVVNNAVVFVAARGGHVRELGYSADVLGYLTGDLSLRAAHLFDGLTVTDQAYQKAPVPTVWFISSGGKLLGLTYIPEQQVGAWHQHVTQDGTFESVAVVPEGDEDVVYVVVKRGDDRFVERLAEVYTPALEDNYYADSGFTYDGAAETVFAGLDHLEGETVAVLADGVASTATVSSGQITLAAAASVVHVGLPMTSRLETLPLAVQRDAWGSGRTKSITKVWARVVASGAFEVGQLGQSAASSGVPAAGSTLTGQVELLIPGTWGDDGQAFIQQTTPLPLHVASLTLEVVLGN